MNKKYITISLPYFKQGDDLCFHLDECDNPYQAFLAHAEQMEEVGLILREVATLIEGKDVEVDAGTHHIGAYVDEDIANKLVEKKIAYFDDEIYEDEEYEEEEEDVN